jgi:predicted aminopeptidase
MLIMSSFWKICLFVSLLTLVGCGEFDYYLQSVEGQLEVMRKSREISEILTDPECPPELRQQLTEVLKVREYASSSLHLPENGSYRSYADLGRPYVVWNVVATPEFSLTPLTWCFPIAGCVPYRGYFDKQKAIDFADGLKREKRDTLVYGVVAYSTLSWFDDPVLNTFTGKSQTFLAALIFHELAHQQAYLPGEAAFNESFAKTVELEGVRRWLADQGDETAVEAYNRWQLLNNEFFAIARRYQGQLDSLYQGPMTEDEKRIEKISILETFKAEVAQLSKNNGNLRSFDNWLQPSLNNARFSSLNTYHEMVPAFQNLLDNSAGDLQVFYAQVAAIAKESPEKRASIMARLKQNRTASLHP